MSSLGDIPFKIPSVSRETPQPVMAPEFPIPDFLRLMWETEYDFHLENWVLAGLVGGSPRHPEVQQPDAPLEFTSSCPPHWLMFSGGPAPCLGSLSLNPKVTTGSLPPKVKFAVSVSDGNRDSCSEDVEGSSNEDPTMTLPTSGPVPVPSLSDNHCLGQSSLPRGVAQHSATHWHLSRPLCLGSPGPCASSTSRDLAPSSTVQTSRLEQHQTAVQSQSPYSSQPHPPSAGRPLDSHTSIADSSAELLSALSQEERDLLETITEQGYPLRTAIIALQKTGWQSPDQVLRYLLSCDRLCELGHDMAEVQEALEMFQNCETKLSSCTSWPSSTRWDSSRTPSRKCCWSTRTTGRGPWRS
ncbi:ubiquitin-associated protein 1-like isoform X2 [Brienomyrus brachyistius]|uniref:ubiquitin-associated protein 1-like isoform X2 n=1 Tax=Brienomyrus brachyistius TaxID=42636 RepID=UPI0020B1C7DD|nr:ubiquitin-associated protein 1-like isoform X2 [Brienomyrus brachyistius]